MEMNVVDRCDDAGTGNWHTRRSCQQGETKSQREEGEKSALKTRFACSERLHFSAISIYNVMLKPRWFGCRPVQLIHCKISTTRPQQVEPMKFEHRTTRKFRESY